MQIALPAHSPMMQRIHFAVTIILLGTISFLLFRPSSLKVAYVDSTKLLNEYEGMKEAKIAYKKKAEGWKSSIDTLSNEVKTSMQAYEKSLAGGSDKEKKLAKELISIKQKQLIEYQKYIQKSAQDEDAKQTGLVLKRVNKFLYEYGNNKGYSAIFTGGQSSNMAYVKPELDITNEVVKALNNEYHAQ